MTRRGGLLPVAWAGGVAFLAVFAGLALQVRGGSDPVLGAGRGESAAVAPRRVLLRRVIQRRVIVRVVQAPLEPASGSAPVTTTGPVASSTPPVSSAPAPAPATPPTTRSS